MNGERLEINSLISAEMLSLNPTYHAYIEKELAEKAGAALMMRIGLFGEEYIVSSDVKEEQIETLNSVNVKATANIKRLVRCKDCKHNPKKDEHTTQCPCSTTGDPFLDWIPDDNWFCADGERE